jgi:hypothetical protein
VESTPSTPSFEPPRRQDDEESDPFDVDFDEMSMSRDNEPRRQDSISEDEAEADAYFKKYVMASFHPDDMTADNAVRVIYPLITKPPDFITIQAVPNLTAQEWKSVTRARDHRWIRYEAGFWPLYAMSYHKAKHASQSQTIFRMNHNGDEMMKSGSDDINAYTYERRIWPK